MHTNRIKILKGCVLALVVVGLSAIAFAFTASMNPPLGALEKWQTQIDVGDFAVHELKKVTFESYPTYVFRKSPEEYTSNGGTEFLLFRTHEYEGTTYLSERQSYYPCGTLEFYLEVNIPNGDRLTNQLLCRHDHSIPINEYETFIYDTNGKPHREWLNPLEVIPYEVNRNGYLVAYHL